MVHDDRRDDAEPPDGGVLIIPFRRKGLSP